MPITITDLGNGAFDATGPGVDYHARPEGDGYAIDVFDAAADDPEGAWISTLRAPTREAAIGAIRRDAEG